MEHLSQIFKWENQDLQDNFSSWKFSSTKPYVISLPTVLAVWLHVPQAGHSAPQIKRTGSWNFPGGPVMKTPHFNGRGGQVPSLAGELRSQMSCDVAKKKSGGQYAWVNLLLELS